MSIIIIAVTRLRLRTSIGPNAAIEAPQSVANGYTTNISSVI